MARKKKETTPQGEETPKKVEETPVVTEEKTKKKTPKKKKTTREEVSADENVPTLQDFVNEINFQSTMIITLMDKGLINEDGEVLEDIDTINDMIKKEFNIDELFDDEELLHFYLYVMMSMKIVYDEEI